MAIRNTRFDQMENVVVGLGKFVSTYFALFYSVGFCYAAPASLDSLDTGSENFYVGLDVFGDNGAMLLSVAAFITLVVFAVLCVGGRECCFNVFGTRGERDIQTMEFSNPIANLGRTSISSIDVRALEMGQIEFEPLPGLHNLTPASYYNNLPHSNAPAVRKGFSESFTGNHPFVVANDETNIYAHDWFEEPYRNFPRTHIEYVKEVGKGWFGQVIESEAEDIVPYAKKLRVLVKVLREDATGTEQMRFLDETRLYRDANHGNILKLLGHSIEKLPFLLIMEQCPQGNLKSFLIANVARAELLYSQGALLRMGYDIARGLEWMASADFVHKDLAARNCQVGSEGRIVIGDYGLAVQNFRDDYYWGSNVAIPLRWCAPETLHCTMNTIQTLKVLTSSNVWTYGVVLWEIFEFGKLPYFDLCDDDVVSRVIHNKNHTLPQLSRHSFVLKEELYKIMLACWNPNPDLRPDIRTIAEIMENLLSSTYATTPIQSPSHSSNPLADNESYKDDFDRKWAESVAKTADSTRIVDTNMEWKSKDLSRGRVNSPKKKSVSFTGLEEVVPSFQINSQSSSFIQPPVVFDVGKRQSLSLSPDVPFEEEDSWKKMAEPVDILQKITRKSLSVQDFMVLTHVELSDLSDPDSLAVKNEDQYDSGSKIVDTPSSNNDFSLLATSVVVSRRNEQERDVIAVLDNHRTESSQLDAMIVLDSQLNSNRINPASNSVCSNSIDTTREGVDSNASRSFDTENCKSSASRDCSESQSSVALTLTPALLSPVNSSSGVTHILAAECIVISSQSHHTPEQQPAFNPALVTSTSTLDGERCNVTKEPESPVPATESTAKIEQDVRTRKYSKEASTPNHADLSIGNDLFKISPSNDVEDFSMELADRVSAVLNPTDTKCLPNTTDKEYGLGNVLLGPSEDLGLQPYQGVTTKFRSEPNTESSEYFDPFMTLPDTSKFESIDTQGMDFARAGESGFQSQDLSNSKLSSGLLLPNATSPTAINGVKGNQQSPAHSSPFRHFEVMLGKSIDKFEQDIEAAAEESTSLVMTDLEDASEVMVKETRDEDKSKGDSHFSRKTAFEKSSVEVGDASAPSPETSDSIDQSSVVSEHFETFISEGSEVRKLLVEAVSNKADEESEEDDNDEELTCRDFVPSKWDQSLAPIKPAMKTPERQTLTYMSMAPSDAVVQSSLRKSVSFERKKTQLVYEYPPPPPANDSDDDEKQARTLQQNAPLLAALDWELQPEELENTETIHDDWEEETVELSRDNPIDLYRISGFDNLEVRPSKKPLDFSSSIPSFHLPGLSASATNTSTLGELRHTKNRLKLDLSLGEASILDSEKGQVAANTNNSSANGKYQQLDSGVGSSTNVSPFTSDSNT